MRKEKEMSVDVFFNPKSVVVIGASNKPGKVGYALARRVVRFQGKVFFVNLKGQSILGKECYASVLDIPDRIDLAVIAVPAVFVKGVVLECCVKNIKHLIIISAGFAEAKHKVLQDEILRIVRDAGARLVGPNTFGVVNTRIGLDCTFAKVAPVPGRVSCVSQSGALWSFIADYSQEHRVGFAKFLSLGDMADVTFTDVLPYLEKDRATKVVLLYMENVPDGRKFMEVVRGMQKPVVVVKAGKTRTGQQAALSHTGSLAGSYEVYRAAFKQVGMYHGETMREALALAKYLSWQPVPQGKKVVIVTNAGGPGSLCADALEAHGLEVVGLPRFVQGRLPGAWRQRNPIDVLGDASAERYRNVLTRLGRARSWYDSIVVIVTPQEMTDALGIAREVVRFMHKTKKPVVCCFMGQKSVRYAKEFLEQQQVPCFHEVEDVGAVLGALQ